MGSYLSNVSRRQIVDREYDCPVKTRPAKRFKWCRRGHIERRMSPFGEGCLVLPAKAQQRQLMPDRALANVPD
jgi:hypothetical protein